MNCKQGDLAIYVKSKAGNEGRIVRVIRWLGSVDGLAGNDWWEIDGRARTIKGDWINCSRDSKLRPIRPDSDPTSFESRRELESA